MKTLVLFLFPIGDLFVDVGNDNDEVFLEVICHIHNVIAAASISDVLF